MRFNKTVLGSILFVVVFTLTFQLFVETEVKSPVHTQPTCVESKHTNKTIEQVPVETQLETELQPKTETQPPKKLRILLWMKQELWDGLMDRWPMFMYRAMLQHSAFEEAIVWGPDLEGYNNSKTIVQNIVDRWNDVSYFDIVYYNDKGNKQPSAQIAELTKHDIVVFHRDHECRSKMCAKMITEPNVSIELMPYLSELAEYKKEAADRLIVHAPHPVSVEYFHYPAEKQDYRTNDIYLAGSLNAKFYPFRLRLSELLKTPKFTNSTLKIYQRPHPGYVELRSQKERDKKGWNAITLDEQIHQFSKELKSSKIAIVTSSAWKYVLQKYGEAAMAGCLLVGSLPDEDKAAFEEFVVDIEGMTDEDIFETIKYYVDNEEERIEKAKKGQEYYLKKRSQALFVDIIVGSYNMYKAGKRGLYYPYGEDLNSLRDTPVFI